MINSQFNLRTDIAEELIEDNKKKMFEDGSSCKVINYSGDIVKHTVKLAKNNVYNREKGIYITIDSPRIIFGEKQCIDDTIKLVFSELNSFAKTKRKILVVGVGNKGQTSDSLGPKVIKEIEKYRIKNNGLLNIKKELLSFAPSIAFRTGIDSVVIIKSLVNIVNPDLVILIDSLCSKKISRVGTSFQISDAGIAPGSGLNNDSFVLNKSTLGVDTIAVGVPMVVFASELAVEFLGDSKLSIYKSKFREKMESNFKDFVVTPKDIDDIVGICAEVISEAIIKLTE